MLVSLVARYGKAFARPRQARTTRCRLEVERLEDRLLPSFQVLATLGDKVSLPTGTAFRINDFESGGLNNQGDIVFGNDLGTANNPATFFGEGVFLRSKGQETVLGSSLAPAPGGGTFDSGFEGPATLNAQGDAAVDFLLQPGGSPFGVNAGAFRFLHTTQQVTAVVQPGITAAPGGGKFAGTSFGPSLDNRGDLFFVGIVPTDKGVHVPGQPYGGLGMGVFGADLAGHIASIVSPGAPAPGGGTFDDAGETYSGGYWVNGRGDVTFVGHVAGEEAQVPGFPPQADFIATLGSVYLKSGATGQIISIAHQGDPAPGGGVFRQALSPAINNRGDVVFTGDLTPAPDANLSLGVFLYSGGKIIPIARPGDLMPGGGHLFSASVVNGQTHLNNQGEIVFNATLDTSTGGVPDTGQYQWSHGQLSLIARSGTVLPGVGTIASLTSPASIIIGPPAGFFPTSAPRNNDRGQVLFSATLTDGRGVLLLFTPTDPASSASTSAAVRSAVAAPAAATDLSGAGNSASTGAVTSAAAAAAETDLSGVAVSLVRSGQNTTRLAEVWPTSRSADAGATAGNDSAVVLPPQARTSPATVSSSASNRSHHRAVDDLFATFSQGLWDDLLA
jgi:hypothetical protein